jgi:hypothetical protein
LDFGFRERPKMVLELHPETQQIGGINMLNRKSLKRPTTKEETITPAQAWDNLQTAEDAYREAVKNGIEPRLYAPRSLSWQTIDSYARDMEHGRWRRNDQGISFCEYNILMNGFHRMWACIRADKPFVTQVTRGLNRATTLETIDRGKVRTLADHIAIIHGLKNPAKISAIIGQIVCLATGDEKKITPALADIVIGLYKDAMLVMLEHMTHRVRYNNRYGNASFVLLAQSNPEETADFMIKYYSGENLKRGDAPLALGRWIENKDGVYIRKARRQVIKYYFTALKAHIQGKKYSSVRADDRAVDWVMRRNLAELRKIQEWCKLNAPSADRMRKKKKMDTSQLLQEMKDYRKGQKKKGGKPSRLTRAGKTPKRTRASA